MENDNFAVKGRDDIHLPITVEIISRRSVDHPLGWKLDDVFGPRDGIFGGGNSVRWQEAGEDSCQNK